MKDTIKTSRTAGYLEKIFRALNNDWFGGELEEPIITIQSTPRAYGHVTVSKIWKSKAGNGGTQTGGSTEPPKRSSTRKYVCPCCKNSVRATKAVNLICGDCMEKMEVVE